MASYCDFETKLGEKSYLDITGAGWFLPVFAVSVELTL